MSEPDLTIEIEFDREIIFTLEEDAHEDEAVDIFNDIIIRATYPMIEREDLNIDWRDYQTLWLSVPYYHSDKDLNNLTALIETSPISRVIESITVRTEETGEKK